MKTKRAIWLACAALGICNEGICEMEGTEMKGTVLMVRMGCFGVNLVGLLGISSPNSVFYTVISFIILVYSWVWSHLFCCIVCT